MKGTLLSNEKNEVKIQITAAGTELKEALDAVYADYVAQHPDISVPRDQVTAVAEGREITQAAIQKMLMGYYPEMLGEMKLQIASEPKITILQASETEGLELRFEFAVRPEMKLRRYKGIQVRMPETEPTEAEIVDLLEQIRRQNVEYEDVERPAQTGDQVVIDFTGYLDGVPFGGGEGHEYPLVLGSGAFIPGFEEQLVGVSAGENAAVKVMFPENYHAEQLAGKEALFRVSVRRVQATKPFIMTREQESEIRQYAAERKRAAADEQIEDEVLRIILNEAQVEIPGLMLESEADICLRQFQSELEAKGAQMETFFREQGLTPDQVQNQMMQLAKRRISLRLVLAAIADAEQITATDEEVEARWDEMAEAYGIEKARLKVYSGDNADEMVRDEVIKDKAYMLLRESTILTNE